MKIKPEIEEYRSQQGMYGSNPGDLHGGFAVPFESNTMMVLSSGDTDPDKEWEHVSVSLKNRCPNWREMCFVKDLFWDEEDTVMQLHPPKSEWVNNHNFCLHLWRPMKKEIPRPPSIAVGVKDS